MNISQDLILACALGIGLFLFAMGLSYYMGPQDPQKT